jgi:GTP-binding protein
LINALTNRASLARVSHTPGRTRQVNLFRIRDSLMLADLPGYGFARVSKAETVSWNVLITEYLHQRRSLRRVVLLIDSRRGLMVSDKQVLSLLDQAAVPTQFVLTKSDEPRPADLQHTREEICREAERHPATLAQVIVTSVSSRAGIPELREALAELAVH